MISGAFTTPADGTTLELICFSGKAVSMCEVRNNYLSPCHIVFLLGGSCYYTSSRYIRKAGLLCIRMLFIGDSIFFLCCLVAAYGLNSSASLGSRRVVCLNL